VNILYDHFYNLYEQKVLEFKRLFDLYNENNEKVKDDQIVTNELKNILKQDNRENEIKVKIDDDLKIFIMNS
jgi:hypothetical protein